MSLEEEAIKRDMDAEYFPPPLHVPQQALLIDGLRLALGVVDGCWLAAADNFSSLRAFDGPDLFRWFRMLVVLYQTCFRQIAFQLHQHAGSVVPFGVIFWMVYLHDFLLMSCMGGHSVGKHGDHTLDLSISLGLHHTANAYHGMMDLSLACVLSAPSAF